MNKSENILKKKLLRQIVIPSVFSMLILIVGYFIVQPATKRFLINDRKQSVKEMVTGINNLLDGYNERVKRGELTLKQAQTDVINIIKFQRYGENSSKYFWIQDYSGQLIYHPALDTSLKQNINIFNIIHGVALQVSQLVKKQNEGFISYRWYPLKANMPPGEKEAFVKGYQPWGWIIGTGFMIEDIKSDLHQATKQVLLSLFAFLGCLLFIMIFVLSRNYKNLHRLMLIDNDLKKSEARFRGFIGHIDNGLMIFENGIPVFANLRFHEIFEIDAGKVLNFQLEEFLPVWEKERVKINMHSKSLQQNIEFTTWILLKNLKEKFISLNYISNNETKIKYNYLVVQDLTEQKQNLTTIDILSENIAQSTQSIIITDLEGNIEYVNPGFENVTGYTFEEVKGKNPRILKSGKMHPYIYNDLWMTVSKGEIWRGEMLNRKKDDTLFWESTLIFPIKNRQGEIIKYSSIKSDITKNKRLEEELIAARNKAEENVRFKTAFLNNVSHEVRTPLNAIYGLVQILKSDINSESTYDYLKIIGQNCHILIDLFDDILDVSNIEARSITLQKEDVALNELILKIVSKYNTKVTVVDQKPIDIIVDEDENFKSIILYTDRKRITQIFDKLLSNAIKYTREGQIKLGYTIDYENITFHVTDTGVGIPKQDQEMIFESFLHGENMYFSLHKGVGLGLNIAKFLVEMIGGKLTFESNEGIGTTFSFNIPTIDVKNYTLNGNEFKKYKYSIFDKIILIAEDNDENFKHFESLLSPHNTIIRAKTGIEAVRVVEASSQLPDIILMDIMMPVMDGISASKLIRNIQPLIPIIALSAISQEVSGSSITLFDCLLTKPVEAQVLAEKIWQLLNTW